MRFKLVFLLLIIFSKIVAAEESELKRFEFSDFKMGVPVRLVLYDQNELHAQMGAEAVYQKFDELNAVMSDYDPESEIIQLCRKGEKNGNNSIPVSSELRTVLMASRYFNEITEGTFDITVSPVVKLWRRSRMFKTMPPEENLRRAKNLVGNQYWSISDHGVQILKPGVRFDLGGIAKGFALDKGLQVLNELGITIALIDAGGDIRVGDSPPDKEAWTIGIASLAENAQPAFYISLKNAAVATSGDTFQFLEINNTRYSHIVDPRSGEPLTRHSVVSVVAPDAMTADALASAMSILEPEKSVALANSLDNVDVLIFQLRDMNNSDFIKNANIFSTDYFYQYLNDKAN